MRGSKHLIVVDMHHIISDGTSLGILMEDFTTLYNHMKPLSLGIQYKDFACWQNMEEQQEALARQQAYWLKMFDGEIPVLELPLDYQLQE